MLCAFLTSFSPYQSNRFSGQKASLINRDFKVIWGFVVDCLLREQCNQRTRRQRGIAAASVHFEKQLPLSDFVRPRQPEGAASPAIIIVSAASRLTPQFISRRSNARVEPIAQTLHQTFRAKGNFVFSCFRVIMFCDF